MRIDFVNLLPAEPPAARRHDDPRAPRPARLVNRAAVHLHGGFVPWPSDGGPFHWFAPDGTHGPVAGATGCRTPAGSLTHDYFYPNAQSARLLWYHDHAVGITRLNAYAGLAAAYVLVDDDRARGCSARAGRCCRTSCPGSRWSSRRSPSSRVADAFGRVGRPRLPDQLQDPDDITAGRTSPLPDISCVPEFFGDTPIVNGKAYPQLTLAAGRLPLPDAERHAVAGLEPAAVLGRGRRRGRRGWHNLDPRGARLHPDRHRGRLPAQARGRAVGQPDGARSGRQRTGVRQHDYEPATAWSSAGRSAPTC